MGPRTESRAPSSYHPYLTKAKEFEANARRSLEEGLLNSAGLEAVHAVISACDALTVFHLGLRSRGPDHRQVLALLGRIPLEGIDGVRAQVSNALDRKNAIEYDGETIDTADANNLVSTASRVLTWVARHLG